MQFDYNAINRLIHKYGEPLYIFDEQGFIDNCLEFQAEFKKYYENYKVAYSFKTNYTPYIIKVVKSLGGYAEVVSGMEYHIAKHLGYDSSHIVFNGPNKGKEGIEAFLNGCIVNVDSLEELGMLINIAESNKDKCYELGLRVNIDVGQTFVSRFGIDEIELPNAFDMVKSIENLSIVGLHCHISRCRSLEAWKKRIDSMILLADKYFEHVPKYIDLGSGMFGSMEDSFAKQFEDVPSYREYAEVVAKTFSEHYSSIPIAEKPILFTEPGTTLINRFIDFIGKVETIKRIKNKNFAVLNCSMHNLGETCVLKELPLDVISCGNQQRYYDQIDLTGYTCLEQDVMRVNYNGKLAIGDYIRFGNVGGYSNVLKPPFISPNCAMISINAKGEDILIKQAESYDDILHTYVL